MTPSPNKPPVKKSAAAAKRKAASVQIQKRAKFRRRWLTFMRMTRYGINNFSRNAWLTVAATAVMTITLLVVLSTFVARQVFADTLVSIREKVDISIFLSNDTTSENITNMQNKLTADSNVESVQYISPEEAQNRSNATIGNTEDLKELSDVLQDTGPLVPSSFSVKVRDLNDLASIRKLVAEDSVFKQNISPDSPPSYSGSNKDTIQRIANAAQFAERVGLVASSVFVIISIMIIFNTIRMAIFNRREEVQMMKLIGADKSFIRGPFIVEAIMYGFFAAIIATGLTYAAIIFAGPALTRAGVEIGPTVDFMQSSPGIVVLVAILIGAVLGVISSQLAVRRYLKI